MCISVSQRIGDRSELGLPASSVALNSIFAFPKNSAAQLGDHIYPIFFETILYRLHLAELAKVMPEQDPELKTLPVSALGHRWCYGSLALTTQIKRQQVGDVRMMSLHLCKFLWFPPYRFCGIWFSST